MQGIIISEKLWSVEVALVIHLGFVWSAIFVVKELDFEELQTDYDLWGGDIGELVEFEVILVKNRIEFDTTRRNKLCSP